MASNTKRKVVTVESRLDSMSNQFARQNTRLDGMETRLDKMMAMLRQTLEDDKNRFNALKSKQQQATDERREHLVLFRENRTATELYREEAQGASQRVEMMQDNLDGFRTDLRADAKRRAPYRFFCR